MPLPADLLAAVAQPEGGRVVIVIGAGCSVDAPTSLPMARQCAIEAHRRLVADNVIASDACDDPSDLSKVADAVFEAKGRQREVVERMPVNAFRLARPNEGHLIAAALLRERSISSVMTLNFDLAMTTALTLVGGTDVAVIDSPVRFSEVSLVNLIYLHRNANADYEQWLLRTAAVDVEWHGQWEEAIATRVLTVPVTVFAGLGSVATVLIDSSVKLREMLKNDVRIYQVDPVERVASRFFAALNIPAESYIRTTWIEFMRELADRVTVEHLEEIRRACDDICTGEHWAREDVVALLERIRPIGLLGLGRMRSRWFLSNDGYVPRRTHSAALVAHLVLAARLMEREAGVEAYLDEDGVVEFRRDGRLLGSAMLISGGGIRSVFALEPEIRRSVRSRRRREPALLWAVVASAEGTAGTPVPEELVAPPEPHSIVRGDDVIRIVTVAELRANRGRAHEVVTNA